MFEFETLERPSMNLNKHWVDYISLYARKANVELLSKTEKFRQNTSGKSTGGREKVEKLITELANSPGVNKNLYDENKIQEKLYDKIEFIDDFNVNQMGLMDTWNGFYYYVWQHVIKEVRTDTYKKGKNMNEVEMIDDNDKEGSGEDENILSISDILYHRGQLADEFAEIDYDATQVKRDIVESLEVFNRYNKNLFVTTKDKKEINCLRLIQHGEAFIRLTNEKRQINNIRGSVEKGHLKTVTSSSKFSGSLGLGPKDYFNKTIETILLADLLGKRELENTIIKFVRAINYLNIDVIWLDADLIVQDDYIQKLKSILYDSSLVFVSQEELDLLEGDFSFESYKINGVRNNLFKNKQVTKRNIVSLFTTSNINKIRRIKASELRKISDISKEMINDYVEMIEKNPILALPETEKRDTAIKLHTPEYLQRVREVETLVLTRGHTIETAKETKILHGTLSYESLCIIKRSIEAYMEDLIMTDPMKCREIIMKAGQLFIGKYKFEDKEYTLEIDKNGFYFFEYTDANGSKYPRYVQEKVQPIRMSSNDSSVKEDVDKWLVNEQGFYVFKSVDSYPRQGKDSVKLWYGSTTDGPTTVIKDILGNDVPIIL